MSADIDRTPDPQDIRVELVLDPAEDETLDLGYEAAMPALQCLFMNEAPQPLR